jgi:hypothetical protein
LRGAVDALYDSVMQSARPPHALDTAVKRLQEAVKDARNAATPLWLQPVSSSLKYRYILPTSIGYGVAGHAAGLAAAAVLGLPGIEVVAAGVGAAAGLAFKAQPAKVKSDFAKNFAYLTHLAREFPRASGN